MPQIRRRARQPPVALKRNDTQMMNRTQDRAPTWPDALALRCPGCASATPIEGLRPDGKLVFYCSHTHTLPNKWFWADSWSSRIEWVNPHLDSPSPWTTEARTRQGFAALALSLFVRSGAQNDGLTLQGTMPDEFITFEHLSGGDGTILMEVGSRLSATCPRCHTRPLDKPSQDILLELGFAVGDWDNYESDGLPPDPDKLAAITERVFRKVYEQRGDYGILARFRQPAMAEAFYLAWTYRADR